MIDVGLTFTTLLNAFQWVGIKACVYHMYCGNNTLRDCCDQHDASTATLSLSGCCPSITWRLLFWWYHKLSDMGSPQWLFLRLKWSKGGLIRVVPSTCIRTEKDHQPTRVKLLIGVVSGRVWSWVEAVVHGGSPCLSALDNCFPVVAF